MIVDRKHTSYHRFSFWDVIDSGVVHTSLILRLLLLGVGAKLREVPGLVAVETWSLHLSHSSR
jgi:hypothetical protein